jgi:hypothetical protein
VGASYRGAPNVNRTLLFDLDSVPTEYVFGALPGVLTAPVAAQPVLPSTMLAIEPRKDSRQETTPMKKNILERLAGRPGLVDRSRLLPLEKPAAER